MIVTSRSVSRVRHAIKSNQFILLIFFFFSSRRRHTRCSRDWSSDVCSSDLKADRLLDDGGQAGHVGRRALGHERDRKNTRMNASQGYISYAVFCLKKKKK